MHKKRVVVSVISDLVSDQRVHRVCSYLHEKGAEVLLIGRSFKDSAPVSSRNYHTSRILCRYRRGPLQYMEFMLKLWIRLFSQKADIFVSNDLDTLLPNYLHSFFRKIPLVYDSHEYFTGAPELRDRKFKQKLWRTLERILLPKIKRTYTVNESVKNQYKKDYGIAMEIVRNVPLLHKPQPLSEIPRLPEGKKILIMQGAGINPERGYEEAIMAMELLPEEFLLVIVGSGTILPELKAIVKRKSLEEKVLFIPRLPFETLHYVTAQASAGLSLDKPDSMNYLFSLPNKIFDYIHAGVPVIASSVPEVKKITTTYHTGICIDNVTAEKVAEAVMMLFSDERLYMEMKENTLNARKILNWENEQKQLDKIYAPLLG